MTWAEWLFCAVVVASIVSDVVFYRLRKRQLESHLAAIRESDALMNRALAALAKMERSHPYRSDSARSMREPSRGKEHLS